MPTAAFLASRKRVFMYEPPSPLLRFIIHQLMLVRIQTHVFEMLEAIFFIADPMVHKPLVPTDDLFCAVVSSGSAAMEDGAANRLEFCPERSRMNSRRPPCKIRAGQASCFSKKTT